MTALSDLIAEMESAREGSRELSNRILTACGWRHYAGMRWFRPDRTNCTEDELPDPSRSLDAALTLLAKGTLYALIAMEDGPIARLCWPQADGGFVGGYFEAKGNTVPLALCSAALRARSPR